ncbi:four helix bundle protein [Sandaracinus amylolyticus]|uniref:four helix bundle protein n=1 Tax=Sandaracinus amylolyticus TaxID=927083 RepID=UPI001F2B2693|nr:four helix bundle protein [Sandaracinus amylolyticus]UJR80011.1 Diversity-generating retroelement protein bAvd family protein [Sandaracinus amylolyticus]
MLDYERLDVYRTSLDFLSLALVLADRVPRGYGPIGDQLRRAATSIPLNVAEAMGRSTRDDRRRHLSIARGSAMECGALLDVIARIPEARVDTDQAKQLIERVVAMLTKLGAARFSTPAS